MTREKTDILGWRALVTGGGRGIGRAIAVSFAQAGAKVVLAARTEKELKETAKFCKDSGGEASYVVADFSDSKTSEAVIDNLLKEHKHFDILVNNAGVGVMGSADEGDPKEWEKMMNLNLFAPMLLTRKISPGMVKKERGIIINIGSVAAIEGMKRGAAYAAAKHGLRGWSLSCYEKLRPYGIKVVLINPGYVNTEMTSQIKGVDFEKMIRPEDVAEAAMLAVRTSPMCCPTEITLRLTRPAYL